MVDEGGSARGRRGNEVARGVGRWRCVGVLVPATSSRVCGLFGPPRSWRARPRSGRVGRTARSNVTSASDRCAGSAERPASGQGLSGVAPRRGETRQATAAQRNPPTTAPAEMRWRAPTKPPQDTPAQPRGEPGAEKVFEEFQE